MSSTLLLRLVLVLSVALGMAVHLISGLELEETRGPFEDKVSSIARFSYPQIYNLYLEPVRKGASIDLIQPNKRSRLFVGKRRDDDYLTDDEDLLLLSEDNEEPFEVKRNHLFVGKRASPRFVGKRSVKNQPLRISRQKRFTSNEYGREDGRMEDSDEGRMWKLWMTAGTGEEGTAADKRSRLFVGKRRELEADDKKRSRLFVGRRAETEDDGEGRRDSGISAPAEVELSDEAAKRSRLFVGKRHPAGRSSSSHSVEEKQPDDIHTPPQAGVEEPTDKRVHLFPGKRPAPSFVGKRED